MMKCFDFSKTFKAARRAKPWEPIEVIAKSCRNWGVSRKVFDEVNRGLSILSVQFLFLEDE